MTATLVLFLFPLAASSEEMKIETFLQLILLLPTAFQFHMKLSVNTALLLDQGTTERKRNKNNLLMKKSSSF